MQGEQRQPEPWHSAAEEEVRRRPSRSGDVPGAAEQAAGAVQAAGTESEVKERFLSVFAGDVGEAEDEDFDADLMEEKAVLVLGLSQSGKSSLINSLMQNQHPKRSAENDAKFKKGHPEGYETYLAAPSDVQGPEIGSGDGACTTGVSIYELFKASRPTHLLEAEPPPLVVVEALTSSTDDVRALSASARSRKALEKWKRCTEYKAELRFGPPLLESAGVRHHDDGAGAGLRRRRGLRIQLIDTPGMSSSDGQDDAHMANILECLSAEEKAFDGLAAIIMVAKMGTPFTPDWLKHIHRYWKQFKQLRNQFIFVHTNCDPATLTSKAERQKNDTCFEECIEERSRRCKEYFANAEADMDPAELSESLRGAPQLFYESYVPRDEDGEPDIGAEVVHHWQMRSTNQLLKVLAAMPTIRLDRLAFVKGPGMQAVDHKMAASLDAEIGTSVQAIKELDDELSAFVGWFLEHAREIAQITAQRDRIKGELALLDCEDLEVVERRSLRAPSWWFTQGTASNQISINPEIPEDKMQLVLDWSNGQEGEVTKNECEDGAWKVEAEAKPGWLYYYAIAGEMVFKVAKSHLHRALIGEKRSRVEDVAQQLAKREEERRAQEMREESKKAKRKATEHRVHVCQTIRGFLARDMMLPEFRVVKGFYRDAQKESWEGQRCVQEFLRYEMSLPSLFGEKQAPAVPVVELEQAGSSGS